MADALIGIGADLDSLKKSLSELPEVAGKEADKAIKEIQRLAIRSSKGVSKAIRQQAKDNDRAQKAAARAARAAAREAERQADEAREAGKALAELAGISADRFDKGRAVLAGLSTPIGQVTVAATAATLAVAGLAAGVVGAGAALVSLTRSAGDALEELEKLQPALGIAPATVARITAANDALDGVVAVSKALVVQLADRVAPAVERTAVVVVKLGLMSVDAFNAMGSGAEAVGNVFGLLGKSVVTALMPSVGLLLDMASITEKIARATGLDSLASGLQDIRQSLTDLPLDLVELGFEKVEQATGDYDARAKALIGTLAALRAEEDKEQGKGKADTSEADAARDAALRAEEALRSYTSALEAARQPFVDRSELASLQRLQAGLVESASAADLSASQVGELSTALSTLAERINEIETQPLRDFEAMLLDVIAAAEAIEIDVVIDVGEINRKALIGRAKEIGQQAANMIGTLTGGALSALANPAQLLDLATGGAKAGKQLAKDAVQFVEALAKNIGPFIRALADALPDVIVALAKAIPKIVVELVKSADDIAIGIVKGIVQGLVAYWRTVGRMIRNAVRDAFGVGRDRGGGGRRRRFGDTPGPIRVDRESTFTFSPGDRVAAGRSDAALRSQVGAGGSGPSSVQVVLDVRDGPVQLGVAVATQRAVDRAGVGRNSTARRSVY